MRAKIDITLRDVIGKLPHEFIRLLTNKEGKKLLDTSLPEVKDKRADLLVELEDESIFHLELQTLNDKQMPFRMLEYYLLIKNRYKNRKIIQMVLYVGDKNLKMQHIFQEDKIIFEYILKDIKEIECAKLIQSEDLDDKILAVLCDIQNESKYINSIIDEVLKLNEKERKDYIKKLLSLSRYRPKINEKLVINIKERVMPITIDLNQDPYYKEGLTKGITQGITQGLSQGITQGLSQGIQALKSLGKNIQEISKLMNIEEEKVREILKETKE
jgi:predicted transposase YdaD